MARIKKIPRGRVYIRTGTLLKAIVKLPFNQLNQSTYKLNIDTRIAKAFDRKHALCVSTCRMAFYHALKVLELKKGDEVLLTPITIPDIVNAIHLLELKPVFVDVDPETHFLDPNALKKQITNRSKVVLLTYLSGLIPNIKPVLEIAHANNLYIIEDISHNYNSSFEGQLVGTFGDFAISSTIVTKSLSSLGGGILMTNEENYYKKAAAINKSISIKPAKSFVSRRLIINLIMKLMTSNIIFSIVTFRMMQLMTIFNPEGFRKMEKMSRSQTEDAPLYDNPPILRKEMPRESFYWFSDLQAEILACSLQHIHEDDQRRIKLVEHFMHYLNNKHKSRIPKVYQGQQKSVFWHLPYMCENPSELKAYLFKNGIDAIGFMMRNCAHEPAFKDYYHHCPGAEQVMKTTVLIPIHSSFTKKDMEHIAMTLNNFE